MMHTVSFVQFDRAQARQLLTCMQTYRHYALSHLLPSQARNALLRQVQTLQGRLLLLVEQNPSSAQISLTRAEGLALTELVKNLLQCYARQADLADRTTTLNEIATLYASLKQRVG